MEHGRRIHKSCVEFLLSFVARLKIFVATVHHCRRCIIMERFGPKWQSVSILLNQFIVACSVPTTYRSCHIVLCLYIIPRTSASPARACKTLSLASDIGTIEFTGPHIISANIQIKNTTSCPYIGFLGLCRPREYDTYGRTVSKKGSRKTIKV